MNTHSIKYLAQHQINKEKWDACLDGSSNGLIYSYSFYLDAMSKHWDGLVLNDYEAVMPLTWNKKYGIYYLYQPFCCALLGISGQFLHPAITNDFLKHIPRVFRYWDICLNQGNNVNNDFFNAYKRKNFILNLNQSYEKLYAKFSDNIKRNIKKAAQLNCSVNKPALAEVLNLAKIQMQQFANVTDDDFIRFSNLYKFLEQKNAATTYGIITANGNLLCACVFFTWQNRAYYILAGNHPDSRSTGSSHMLIDAFIKDHSETNMILDFEGSDIPSLALFYSSFGAIEENYPGVRYNRLPSLIRWLKK
ncbi:MAG: hypothetical protein ABJC98_02050 [Bacteroidota bacterium]